MDELDRERFETYETIVDVGKIAELLDAGPGVTAVVGGPVDGKTAALYMVGTEAQARGLRVGLLTHEAPDLSDLSGVFTTYRHDLLAPFEQVVRDVDADVVLVEYDPDVQSVIVGELRAAHRAIAARGKRAFVAVQVHRRAVEVTIEQGASGTAPDGMRVVAAQDCLRPEARRR